MKFGRFFRPAAFFSFLGMLFPLVLNSCSQISGAINEPVREYFERGSTVTQIVSHEILSVMTGAPAATAKDKDGHICVGSASDIKVKLHVNNPMNYTFTEGSNLSYYLVDSTSAALTDADLISLSMTSSTEWELTYPASFLTAAEYGKNISVRIDLSHPETGTAFPSYTVPLYCNSAPPTITDAVVYTNNTSNRYVIAFSVPPLNNATDNDLRYIIIGGTTIPITLAPVGTSPFSYLNTSLVPANIETLPNSSPNGISYSCSGGTPFYFITTDAPSPTDKVYTLSLVDSAGITTSIPVNSNSAYTLNNVTLKDSSGNVHNGSSVATPPIPAPPINLGQDTGDFYAKVNMSVPTQASCNTVTKAVSGVSVSYTVTNVTSGTEFDSGTKTSSFDLSLPPGHYTIECTAHKAGYVDSTTTFDVHIKATNVFVKNTGSDTPTTTGSKADPFATIDAANTWLGSYGDPASTEKTIYILSDLDQTSDTSATNTVSNADYVDCGNKKLKNIALDLSDCTLKKATIENDSDKKITVSNATLEDITGVLPPAATPPVTTNKNIVTGSGISITGKIKNLTFELGTSKKISVTGSLTGSSNNKVVLTDSSDEPTDSTPRTFTDGYPADNSSVLPHHYFTSSSYIVTKHTTSGEAILKASSGVSGDITVYTPDGKLSITATPGTATTTAIPVTLSATGTLPADSPTASVYETNTTYFTDWDIKVYYEYDYRHSASPSTIMTPTTSPSTALQFQNAWPAGNYVIVVNVTFNGTAYCQELIYTKS